MNLLQNLVKETLYHTLILNIFCTKKLLENKPELKTEKSLFFIKEKSVFNTLQIALLLDIRNQLLLIFPNLPPILCFLNFTTFLKRGSLYLFFFKKKRPNFINLLYLFFFQKPMGVYANKTRLLVVGFKKPYQINLNIFILCIYRP